MLRRDESNKSCTSRSEDVPELNQLANTILLTSDLAGLTLETFESHFVIEACDLVDRHGQCNI